MIWAAPWAWLLAAGVALPLAAHLWSRHRPTVLAFPTLRLLREASPVSRRLRRIQDWPLLCLRTACVLAIVAAAAGPTVHTAARANAWRTRLHRIVLVDERVTAPAAPVVRALVQSADSSVVIGPGDMHVLMASAKADIRRHASKRVELAVVWDGSRSRLSAADFADVDAAIGIRLETVEVARPAMPSFAGPSGPLPISFELAPVDAPARLVLDSLLRAHAPAISGRRVHVWWPGAVSKPAGESSTPAAPAVRRALDRLAADPRVRGAAERSIADSRAWARQPFPPHARILARSMAGQPLLWGWPHGDDLAIALASAPSSPLAYWSVFAAMDALSDPVGWADALEGSAWTAAERTAVARAAAVPTDAPLPAGLDTRSTWLLALLLLIAEQVWRTRARSRATAAPDAV